MGNFCLDKNEGRSPSGVLLAPNTVHTYIAHGGLNAGANAASAREKAGQRSKKVQSNKEAAKVFPRSSHLTPCKEKKKYRGKRSQRLSQQIASPKSTKRYPTATTILPTTRTRPALCQFTVTLVFHFLFFCSFWFFSLSVFLFLRRIWLSVAAFAIFPRTS